MTGWPCTNYMRLRRRLVQTIRTDAGLCALLTLLAGGTRWFFFQGRNAVPFEIQDEITLVWALKDFLTGHWHDISGPIHRFVASYAFLPFFGSYFVYHWLIGAISGFTGVIESFLLQTAHANNSVSVWVWVPRLVSWLSLVLSVPLQFVLISNFLRTTGYFATYSPVVVQHGEPEIRTFAATSNSNAVIETGHPHIKITV